MNKEKLIIIDGNSLMHRAFYALPPLTNSKGLHTNVIYGFINMLYKIIDELKPTHIGIAFDRKAPTFRHNEYADYKAGRQKMSEDMIEQIPVLKEVIGAMNIKQLEIDGYEADDIIGTVAELCTGKQVQAHIVTGDRDAFQLINEYVHVLITKKGISEIVEFDRAKLLETYEYTPEQVTDMKGLMGDASDNIPGVPGIGEKTALELIKQFGTLENTLEHCAEVKKNKVRENLQTYSEQAIFSKKLATIIRNVPIEICLEDFEINAPDNEKLYHYFKELEFKTLVSKLEAQGNGTSEKQETQKVEVRQAASDHELAELTSKAQAAGQIAFKLSGEAHSSMKAYISVAGDTYCFDIDEKSKQYLKQLMEDEKIAKAGHDVKQDVLNLMSCGISINNISFDTMLAAYVLDPAKGSYNLGDLSRDILQESLEDYKSKEGSEEARYAGSAAAIAKLVKPMAQKIKEDDMEKLYYEVELPLLSVLADMEHEGFKVDKSMLQELSVEFSTQIDALTEEIYGYAEESFNINSTKQLGVILFEKLGLPVVKKTKTGYSTDVEVLETLQGKHPIIEKILEYRQLLKIKSTYIDGMINVINPETGKIHSKLNQTVTATGRLSSTDPNLQNIPIKTENGRKIRKVFVSSSEEYTLVDADYSQIELRVLAHISGDESFIDAFVKNEDIHTRTASEVFNVPRDQVTPLMRGRAKAVNFGIVYGISDYGLSKDLKITKKEAKTYIDSYFSRYPKVKEYLDNTVADAKEKGYVTTVLNRRRYIPEILSRNAIQRGMGERIAMNTPIQGSAADIIKVAMIKVYDELKDRKMKSKLILQVHDELIVETHISEVDQVKELVVRNMQQAMDLKVPLTAEVNTGNSWYDAK
ncbi:MAG: polymerase [Clostridia bacterium]|jgi:DNA polymerase-1|nr:polymerase [Clostridia bacterium]